jgi:hypothetical protein
MRHYLMGREVYRRSEYIALMHGDEVGLATVSKESLEPLFSPVTEVEVWAGPDRMLLVEDPLCDVGNATALARTALEHARPDVSGYLIKGMFEHINFIWEPNPIMVHVTEVTPPDPPKLFVQATQVVAFDEDLPPVELVVDAVTFPDLAARAPSAEYLLPCRGSGADLPGQVSFLDTRPAERHEWVMIGCERSLQFHRHFYGDEPPQVDICPRARIETADPEGLWLVKCCLLERGIDYSPGRAVVPWGANLDEVRRALRLLAGVDELVPA